MSKITVKKAALKLFAEKGYDGTALSEIAQLAGIKTPSIYAHFSSKEALFMEIYQDVIQKELNSFKEASKEDYKTARDLLQSVFYKATDFKQAADAKKFFQRTIYYPPKTLQNKLKEEASTYETLTFQALGEILVEEIPDEISRKHWLHIFYCLIDGLSVEHELYHAKEFEERRCSAWLVLESLMSKEHGRFFK
ncbi:TetR/AcrR family transcriptional regulator [Listeria sp. PSOL-1]|uniref:TetR/AcrR family transcriptional regulator n=1 Tax=Listeria sp. PSOL-1 TaxID=1844999 RepID=UPI0013D76B45|nr:TetR/AcrR family transcriptional regulator [Listeria sp. PSOL-1]